jgi:hypothetical protein
MATATFPTADEAAAMAQAKYASTYIAEIQEHILQAIAEGRLQTVVHRDLHSDFSDAEGPLLRTAIENHFNPKGYGVEIKYYGGGWSTAHGMKCRVTWFPKRGK